MKNVVVIFKVAILFLFVDDDNLNKSKSCF